MKKNPVPEDVARQFDVEGLRKLVSGLLDEARRCGATAAEVGGNLASGLSVTVRKGEVETIEHNRDKGMGVTVYFGQRKGSASTTEFSTDAVKETVKSACEIARYTAEDPCHGLAPAESMAREIPDLDLYHPWNLAVEDAIELARRCERAALVADSRIRNSEGASVNSHAGFHIYGNSHGFLGAYPTTRHSVSCSVIATEGEEMQRDFWYTTARDANRLEPEEAVGRRAAERAVRRLGARRLSTTQVPVLFSAEVAGTLLSHFVGAVRGSALYRKSSFLLDRLGEPIFPEFVRIYEQPHLKGALGSAPFDQEGVATRQRDLVREGILQGYVLDSYSACKLGMQTTGNAGGVHNLTIAPGASSSLVTGSLERDALLRQMDRGLLVTELMGHGVRLITGDYSRGAAGFWVEGGEIQYPVEGITVAGNLRDMFRNLVMVGSDVDLRGNLRTGSWLVEQMTVAGE